MLSAGTTMFVRSTGDAVTVEDATSGGTMTLWASTNVSFRSLTTTGTGSDAGDIILISDNAAIVGGSVNANGSARMTAATTITGTTVTAVTGRSAMTAGGLIGWTSLTAGTTMNLRSTGGVIDIPSIMSGGTQTLRALQNVTFTTLTTTGIAGDAGHRERHLRHGGDRRRRHQCQRLDQR